MSNKYGNTNKEGRNNLFYPRDVIDLMNMVFIGLRLTLNLKVIPWIM